MNQSCPRAITVVSILMILFGLAEVVTSFTHNFFGITTARSVFSISAGIVVGALYIAAGLLILSAKRWSVIPAMACLGADILGRIAMILTGLFPVNSFFQLFAIVMGTAVAAAFALYIWSKRNVFY